MCVFCECAMCVVGVLYVVPVCVVCMSAPCVCVCGACGTCGVNVYSLRVAWSLPAPIRGHVGISEQKPLAGFAPMEGTRLGAFNGWTSWVMGSGERHLRLHPAQSPGSTPSMTERRRFGQGIAQMWVQLQLHAPKVHGKSVVGAACHSCDLREIPPPFPTQTSGYYSCREKDRQGYWKRFSGRPQR